MMHRHCLRSSLSQCAKNSRRTSIKNVKSLSSQAASSSSAGPSTSMPPKVMTSEEIQNAALAKKYPTSEYSGEGLYWTKHMNALKEESPRFSGVANPESSELIEETSAHDEEDGAMTGFTPGTFVEVRKNENVVQAIVLGEHIENQRWIVLSLTPKGQVLHHYRADVHFAIPNLISASLAERCGLESEPTPQQIAARVEALKRLRGLTSRVDRQASGLQQRPMDVYIHVKDTDATKWATTTVAQVTHLLYDRPLFMDYYMTHRYLTDRPLEYVTIPGYLKNQSFAVRPKRDIDEIQAVQQHIYDHRDDPEADLPFKQFIQKARRVVAEFDQNKNRPDKGDISQQPTKDPWAAEEQIFLKFLLRSLQPHRSNQVDPYAMGRTTIIKNILPPSTIVDDSLAHELLIKLGVLAPWQDLLELSPTLNPWGNFGSERTIESEAKAVLKACSKAKAGAVLGPMDFLPSDPLDSVRHGFGDARAFVIDDATAEELDDAVSVERIPTEPQNHWIHVHIADPARVLHPNHALARLARGRFSSFYLAQKTYPLFPAELVHDPAFALSLSGTNTVEPTRVLSFSVKVDGQANILNYKVRAGLIRNVRRASYYDVDLALDNPIPKKHFPFGGSEKLIKGPPLNERDIADLKLLQKLADDQVAKRFKDGLFYFSAPASQVIWNSKVPDDVRSPSLSGSVYYGFPDMTYAVYDTADNDIGARSLVSEMMKLANRVTSRFALEHNVPMIRRTLEPIIMSPEAREEILALRSPHGYVPIQEILQRIELNPSGAYSLEPKQHHGLGIPDGEGYSRATSPLRRFEDIVAHWQLHHILLGKNAPPKPPFDIGDLEKLAAEFEALNQAQRKLHTEDTLFYSLLYLKRWADATKRGIERNRNYKSPLSLIRGWTRQRVKKNILTNESTVVLSLPDLGIHAHLALDDVPSNKRKDIPIGTKLDVKLQDITLGVRRAKMTVAPIRRTLKLLSEP
ncbi:hypothetical protein GALMADRAFT_244473, partial [Galerina marginata CBS 339.88]